MVNPKWKICLFGESSIKLFYKNFGHGYSTKIWRIYVRWVCCIISFSSPFYSDFNNIALGLTYLLCFQNWAFWKTNSYFSDGFGYPIIRSFTLLTYEFYAKFRCSDPDMWPIKFLTQDKIQMRRSWYAVKFLTQEQILRLNRYAVKFLMQEQISRPCSIMLQESQSRLLV